MNRDAERPEPAVVSQVRPIYIAGRQHCGNTMLASMLGNHPEVRAFTGEGTFFEHIDALERMPLQRRVGQITQEIAHGDDPPLSKDEQASVRQDLEASLDASPTAAELYARGKEALTRREGRTRWVQKATSYVFQVDSILRRFPKAHILFLVRNPLDLAASAQRRGQWKHIGRTIWGWNTGVERALGYRDQHPDSVMTIRYEDLVSSPEREARRVCSFCGLTYDEACLHIAHVNRSEQPYTQKSKESGLNTSRVFYYRDVLSSAQEMAVRRLVSTQLADELYPDLPSPPTGPSIMHTLYAGMMMGISGLFTLRDQSQSLVRRPAHTVRRIRKRVLP